jgi:hypothetical protein
MTLKGHWVLDEDSGATAYDYSGNEHHGDISGAGPQGTGTVTGPFGNSAYDFDGSNDIVRMGDIMADINDFTYAAWIYVPSGVTSGSGTVISTTDEDDANGNPHIVGQVLYDNGIQFRVTDGNADTSEIQSSTDIGDGWFHIAFTRNTGISNGPDGLAVYVDGIDIDAPTQFDQGTTQTISVSTAETVIGAGTGGSGTGNYYEGGISDARLYKRALSPQEVQSLYQAGVNSRVTLHDS